MELISVREIGPDVTAAALDHLPEARDAGVIVCAGDLIEADTEEGFLRGHGTQPAEEALRATQCGLVRHVNKLVSVQSLRQRYVAEMGDVVVGQVVETSAKRWNIDLRSRQEAGLLLAAVNLPGNAQRRRTAEDELNMRSVYTEGDILSAEVQSVHHDGGVSLQTRGTKFGKLKGGQLVVVPSILVPRQKQHFVNVEGTGVGLVLGVNGFIWVGWNAADAPEAVRDSPDTTVHEQIARAANAIRVLSKLSFSITPARISELFRESFAADVPVSAMLHESFLVTACKIESKFRKFRKYAS